MDESTVFDWLAERLSEDDNAEIGEFLHGLIDGGHEYREASEAKIAEYAANETEMKESIQDLKARNYDLLMQTPADDGVDGDLGVEDDVADDGEVIHVDDLFDEGEDD